MYNNKSDKILTLMYPKLSTKYIETKGGKLDDKTLRRIRLILNSKYGVNKYCHKCGQKLDWED